ncbi:MAG: DUF4159 domain-containing protein [Verrucomicrobiae bacterium]|nr:DUF4159 domain-containing protein [Verrucomicrobiae bacterium]
MRLKTFIVTTGIWLLIFGLRVPAGAPPKEGAFEFAMVRYGGKNWEKNEELINHHGRFYIPNFLKWLNENKVIKAREEVRLIDLSNDRLFNYPLLFMDGCYGFELTAKEKENLKAHLQRGGFLFADDCGGQSNLHKKRGRFSVQLHDLLTNLFPEGEWRVLPPDHDIYRAPYSFPKGLPNFFGPENDRSPDTAAKKRKGQGGEGFFHQNRMIVFFSDADIGCVWIWAKHTGLLPGKDGQEMKNRVEEAYKMGANIVIYAMTH